MLTLEQQQCLLNEFIECKSNPDPKEVITLETAARLLNKDKINLKGYRGSKAILNINIDDVVYITLSGLLQSYKPKYTAKTAQRLGPYITHAIKNNIDTPDIFIYIDSNFKINPTNNINMLDSPTVKYVLYLGDKIPQDVPYPERMGLIGDVVNTWIDKCIEDIYHLLYWR